MFPCRIFFLLLFFYFTSSGEHCWWEEKSWEEERICVNAVWSRFWSVPGYKMTDRFQQVLFVTTERETKPSEISRWWHHASIIIIITIIIKYPAPVVNCWSSCCKTSKINLLLLLGPLPRLGRQAHQPGEPALRCFSLTKPWTPFSQTNWTLELNLPPLQTTARTPCFVFWPHIISQQSGGRIRSGNHACCRVHGDPKGADLETITGTY